MPDEYGTGIVRTESGRETYAPDGHSENDRRESIIPNFRQPRKLLSREPNRPSPINPDENLFSRPANRTDPTQPEEKEEPILPLPATVSKRIPKKHRGRMRLPALTFLPNRVRNEMIAIIAEFCGTFMFLFFAFSGTQVRYTRCQSMVHDG